jgi:hypothetical protein
MIDPRQYDESRGTGCGTRILLGVFAVAAVAMLAMIALAFIIPRAIDRAVETYTDAAPLPVRGEPLPPEEREELDARVDEFAEALDANEPTEPLVLTEEELNAVLAEEIDEEDGSIYLELIPGQVRAQVSLPIKAELPLGPWARDLTGRYLNGTALVDLRLNAGRLDFTIREFDVKGHKLPGYAVDALQKELERTGVFEDDDVTDYLQRVSELRIEPGRIVLIPRAVSF